MAESSRPTKRRRMRPDGFAPSTSLKYKTTVPTFVSAFDKKEPVCDTIPDDKKKASVRRAEKLLLDGLTPGLSSRTGMQSDYNGDTSLAQKSKLDGETKGKPLSSVLDVSKHTTSEDPPKRKIPPQQLRPAPPPPTIVSVPNVSNVSSEVLRRKKKQTPVANLLPAPAPPAVVSSSTNTITPLKKMIPPVFPSIKPLSTSKALQQCVIPDPRNIVSSSIKPKSTKALQPMSKTGLGLLPDSRLSSELQDGDAYTHELASILLLDQHPEIFTRETNSDPHDMTRRGLDMSPDKKGKNKYLRGGMAAHASAYFDRSLTAFVLWKKEMERKPANTLPAELRTTIVKILHMPLPPSNTNSNTKSSPGIALCRILQQNGTAHAIYKSDHLYRVVFSFPSSNFFATNIPGHFVEGQTILVFRPWHETSLRLDGGTSDRYDSELPRLPASLPLPLSAPYSTPDPLDAPVNETALLCSRFSIDIP